MHKRLFINCQFILVLIVSVLLMSCNKGNAQKDIDEYIKNVKETQSKSINTTVNNKIESKIIKKQVQSNLDVSLSSVDQNCQCNYIDISSAKMVGSIISEQQKIAFIRLPDHSILTINIGDRFGKACAIVKNITIDRIEFFGLNKKIILHIEDDGTASYSKSADVRGIDINSQIISLNVHRIPLRLVIKNISRFAHKNIAINPSVKGDLSLFLNHVSLRDVLKIILRSQNLIQKQINHILYITTMEEVKKYKETAQLIEEKGQLKSFAVKLKYAKASEIAQLMSAKNSSFLSKEGRVLADNRTNTIIFYDFPETISNVRSSIQRLDRPSPQILIKAKIVNIDDDYEKDLGVKFNLYHKNTTDSGGQLFVDLPGISDVARQSGLALIKLLPGTYLDLELSALESEGKAEIISTPSLLTTNQKPAKIEAGEDIPYQESVSQGVTATAFKKAVLSLQVTPQIMSDHKILLSLEVNQDKRSNQEVKGVPAIDTRHIMTQVLVNDGETVVLGGIYEFTKIDRVERLPFLSDLPVLGVLFRNKKTVNNRRELLIFVTPKIIN